MPRICAAAPPHEPGADPAGGQSAAPLRAGDGRGGVHRLRRHAAAGGRSFMPGDRARCAELCRTSRRARCGGGAAQLPLRPWRHPRPRAARPGDGRGAGGCGDAPGRRKPCRSLARRAGGVHRHQHHRHLSSARSGAGALAHAAARRARGLPLTSCLHRRSVWRPALRQRPLHRGVALQAQLALFGVEGGGGPSGARLAPQLWPAGGDFQLLQQLRAVAA